MYFPHAFHKAYLPKVTSGAVELRTTGKTDDLLGLPGQIGFYDAKTWTAQATGGKAPFVLVQGSYKGYDNLGGLNGGAKESIKSKTINPKYITRLIKANARTAQNQIVEAKVCNTMCNTTYRMRVMVKGAPALQLLTHNAYKTVDGFTGCCVNPASPDLVDPTIVAIQWAKGINEDPILSKFITASVKDSTGATVNPSGFDSFVPVTTGVTADKTASVVMTVAYVDTKFGNCTFTRTDSYNLEPAYVEASMVNDSGDPCFNNCFSLTENQAPRTMTGSGETVLRELILDASYRQESFADGYTVDSLRMREIEGSDVTNVSRTGLYDKLMIVHVVPRFINPSSVFDNEKYVLNLYVPSGTDTKAIETFILAATDAVGSDVSLETI